MAQPRRELIQRLRKISDHLHATDLLKTLLVEARRSGERVKFALQGAPDPASAILVVGSGRSGTTWLMNTLASSPGLQEIFEPLNPRRVPAVDALTGWHADHAVSRAYYLRADGDYPAWRDLLERILCGQVRNYWTDYTRSSYWPDRFLIKLIRANLMLGYLYDHFRPTILYVTRHPCAVVLSRLRRGWQASVQDILAQEALVEDHLRPWLADIERESDLLGAHAVWWAVENRVAQHDLSSRPHYALTYEEMALAPAETFARLASWLGLDLPADWQARAHAPVRHSRHLASAPPAQQRLALWQQELDQESQARILSWAQRLGVEDYDAHALPRSLRASPSIPNS